MQVDASALLVDHEFTAVICEGALGYDQIAKLYLLRIASTYASHDGDAGLVHLQDALEVQHHLLWTIARQPGDMERQRFVSVVVVLIAACRLAGGASAASVEAKPCFAIIRFG